LGWLFPTEWKNKKCSKAPTINIHLSYGCIVFLVWLVEPDIDQLYQEKKSIWWWSKTTTATPWWKYVVQWFYPSHLHVW
jgi:hypothetical protein